MGKCAYRWSEIPGYTGSRERVNEIIENNKRAIETRRGKILFNSVFIDLNFCYRGANNRRKWAACNLRCPGCFKLADRQENQDMLTLQEIREVVGFARERNAVSITIAGAGEPLLDPHFWKLLKYANKRGMGLNVFTNGTLIDRESAKILFEGKTNVIVKRNTLVDAKQDMLVGNIRGGGKKIKMGLDNLLKAGFKAPRLAIDSYVSKQNASDLPALLRYCRKNQIIPYFEAFITAGQEEERYKGRVLSGKELSALFKKLQRIDKREFGIKTQVISGMRVYGQAPCTKSRTMFSARTNGDIAPCVASGLIIGNMRRQPLKEIFNPKKNRVLSEAYLAQCRCSAETA
jgi:MoaA/NifB/PqqE/SkfB family radical SAM enzyme